MVNHNEPALQCRVEHNFEQSCAVGSAAPRPKPSAEQSVLPAGAVVASFIKTLETEFISRGLISPPRTEFSPVWFLVETERNVFLWRSGCSLCEADEFEFWVDPAALIEKRLAQLECADPGNPFVSPLWGLVTGAPALSIDEEKHYLAAFLETLAKVAPHAHALSHVASVLGREPAKHPLPKVLLPQARRQPR